MSKINKLILSTTVIYVLFLGGQGVAYAQNIEAPREPSTGEGTGQRPPSQTRRVLINIAKAVIEVLCAEYGDCPSTNNRPTETTAPSSREDRSYATPSFAGPSGSTSTAVSKRRNFSFDTPAGWQSYEDQSSVTVALPSEYINGNLTNGVILGLFDLNNASFETGTETYVRQMVSNNKYLRRAGSPESNIVEGVPCITNRMGGQSPKTRYFEQVVVDTCKRNAQKLFYVVTVTSGPNANRYGEENSRITQSIKFR